MLVSPDELVTAAQRVAIMGSDVAAVNLAAAASTTGIAAAARDEVSEGLSSLFSAYAQQFHAAVEQTGLTGVQQFAQRLTSGAGSYAATEAANTEQLIPLTPQDVIILAAAVPILILLSPLIIAAGAIFLAVIVIYGF